MERLLIDCTFVINELKRKRPPHGLPRVILAYLRHYSGSVQLVYRVRNKIFIFPQSYSQKIIELVLLWDFKLYKTILTLIIKGILSAERVKKEERYFLFKIDQNGMKYPSYFTQLHKMGIKTLVVIHDLFPIIYPEYSDIQYAVQFEDNVKKSLLHASGMICVSHDTQNKLAHYAQKNNIASPPTVAANLAPGLLPSQNHPIRLIQEPYFVILSTIVTRKNHLFLLHLWRKLVNDQGDKAPKLVIIGKRSSECSSTLAMLDRCTQIRHHVVELTVNDSELHNYLSYAQALLFPTFAEGYGLPLIEALSINVPVLCSNLDVFHEIALNVPEYIDPIDGKAWLDMIIEYTQEDSLLRNAQLKRIQQFTIPKWENHFKQVDALIKTIPV